MNIEQILQGQITAAIEKVFGFTPAEGSVQVQQTRKEFEGDLTLVVFPFVKNARKSPEETAHMLGDYLTQNSDLVADYNVVKGFLNMTIIHSWWNQVLVKAQLLFHAR